MAAEAVGVSREHITKTPGVCGGRACVAGTRIRVMDVVLHHEVGKVPATEIASLFCTPITLADVYAALTYYFDHREEIEADIEAHDRAAEFGKTQPSLLRDALARNPDLRERFGG